MSESQAGPSLEREDIGDVTVLRVKLPMLRSDEPTEALFQHAFAVVDEAGRSRLVMSLDGVVHLASAAIGRLVVLMRKARAAGGKLALCKVTRNIAEMLQMTHITDILLIYADEQEAVRSFA